MFFYVPWTVMYYLYFTILHVNGQSLNRCIMSIMCNHVWNAMHPESIFFSSRGSKYGVRWSLAELGARRYSLCTGINMATAVVVCSVWQAHSLARSSRTPTILSYVRDLPGGSSHVILAENISAGCFDAAFRFSGTTTVSSFPARRTVVRATELGELASIDR